MATERMPCCARNVAARQPDHAAARDQHRNLLRHGLSPFLTGIRIMVPHTREGALL